MGRLTGKAAVVTGGALGLGHAICRRMAEEGAAAVRVLDTLEAEGQALADALTDQGARLSALPGAVPEGLHGPRSTKVDLPHEADRCHGSIGRPVTRRQNSR